MPSFEEEAFSRAQQMRRRQNRSSPSEPPKRDAPIQSTVPPEEGVPEQKPARAPQPRDALESLFRDKDQSLIMLLILLLMDEKSDPSLLLALMYLLM